MASKTTNFNLTKPSAEDFYDINVSNENMDIIDAELKRVGDVSQKAGDDAKSNLDAHLKASNPHKITATTVGLGNVPNVTTNDQTPTYTEATTLTNIASGEKLTVTLGKIKKLITDYLSHLVDNVKHITAAERTSWNAKAPSNHTSPATSYGVGTESNYGHLKITNSKTSTATDTAASAKALKEVNDKLTIQGYELLKTININANGTGDGSIIAPVEITGINWEEYRYIRVKMVGTITVASSIGSGSGFGIGAINSGNPTIPSFSFDIYNFISTNQALAASKTFPIDAELDYVRTKRTRVYGNSSQLYNDAEYFNCQYTYASHHQLIAKNSETLAGTGSLVDFKNYYFGIRTANVTGTLFIYGIK
ncbi:MAG: tail fiber protein [Clostridia bacterium]|nr:tail fiber protein [Clostridia bacterium]